MNKKIDLNEFLARQVTKIVHCVLVLGAMGLSSPLLAKDHNFKRTEETHKGGVIILGGKVIQSFEQRTIPADRVPKPKGTQTAENGSRAGGGGGFYCPVGSGNKMDSIDYRLAKLEEEMQRATTARHQFKSGQCSSILESIRRKLIDTNPALAAGLRDFMIASDRSQWQDSSNVSLQNGIPPRVWIKQCNRPGEQMGCLGNIADDQFGKGKVNCPKVQIAERIPWNGLGIITLVDVKAAAEIEKDPIQCSHFYVHEWMRDFIADALTIRRLTYYLHSEAFFESKTTFFANPNFAVGANYDQAAYAAANPQTLLNYYNQSIKQNWPNPYVLPSGAKIQSPSVEYSEDFFHRGTPLTNIIDKRNEYHQLGASSSFIETRSNGYWLFSVFEH